MTGDILRERMLGNKKTSGENGSPNFAAFEINGWSTFAPLRYCPQKYGVLFLLPALRRETPNGLHKPLGTKTSWYMREEVFCSAQVSGGPIFLLEEPTTESTSDVSTLNSSKIKVMQWWVIILSTQSSLSTTANHSFLPILVVDFFDIFSMFSPI